MTRDFNKQKRDDSRPSFRNQSPNRNRDERSPRPARPRLNRETVDRAWESGAQQQHADYRPRTTGGQYRPQGQGQGQQQRNSGWRNTPNSQQSGYSSQNGRGGSRPSNNRQENYRDNRPGNYRDDRDRRDSRDTPRSFGRPSGDTHSPRPRPSYGPGRSDVGGQQRFNGQRDSFNGPNRRGSDNHQQFQDRGNQRRDVGRNDRPIHNTYGDRPQRETPNPRWQSRPGDQRNNARGPEREFNRRPNAGNARFEGDYEHFEERDTRDSLPARPARPMERPFSGSRSPQDRPVRRFNDQKGEAQPERHITRLPDGRVLKGPRPVQRRNAQFWTDVTKDKDELLGHVNDSKPGDETQEIPTGEVLDTPSALEEMLVMDEPRGEVVSDETSTGESAEETPQKRRTRIASAVARSKKPARSSTSGAKPSQRGFKWPTQQ